MVPSDHGSTKKHDPQQAVHSTNGAQRPKSNNGAFASAREIGNAFSSETHAQGVPTLRTDRLRRAVNRTCRAIIRGYDQDAILAECCRYLVEEGGYKVVWAGLSSDQEASRIVPAARAGIVLAMDDHTGTETTEALLQATASRCVRKRSPQVVRPERPKAAHGNPPPRYLLEGNMTVCAVPLDLGPHGQGAFALGTDDPDAFQEEEVALLRDLANDLGHGISMLIDRAAAGEREDRLLKDQEFHAALFQHTPHGAFVASPGGRLVQANPAFARLLGYPDAQSLLADSSATLYTIVAPGERNRLMAALDGDEEPRTHDVMMRRKDNTSVPAKITVQPIQGSQGKYLQAFVHDLGARP